MLFAVLRPAGFFVVALTLSAAAHAQEQQVAIKAADENATVRLLTAPHTGKRLIMAASYLPSRWAAIVLEGKEYPCY